MALLKNMGISAALLGIFAIIGTGLVSLTYVNTAERIAANERAMILKNLHALITPEEHDNDLFTDTINVSDKLLSGRGEDITIYRARKQEKPVAAIINAIAPDGYNGNIALLVAIRYDGALAGVRVVRHRETPGLGDAIEISRSDWMLGFNGKSLNKPEKKGWAVKRDGGDFDQFTGATITPRAVVKAVYRALLYFDRHREALFAPSKPLKDDSRHE